MSEHEAEMRAILETAKQLLKSARLLHAAVIDLNAKVSEALEWPILIAPEIAAAEIAESAILRAQAK